MGGLGGCRASEIARPLPVEDMLKTRCRYAEDVPSGVTALLAAGTK
jgi:hypothetical protein